MGKLIQTKITDFFKKTEKICYGYNGLTGDWHCLDCGGNMGNNPSQLCKDCFRFLTNRTFK